MNVLLGVPEEMKGHQGQWTLEVIPSSDVQNLQSFLRKKLPPPSRLYINLSLEPQRRSENFFEDPSLPEFMRIYSEHVTHLRITCIQIPFLSAKEIGFYESFIKLENLQCDDIRIGTEGSCVLLPSTFKNLKTFHFDNTRCTSSTLTILREMKGLETIVHCPFEEDSRVLRPNVTPVCPVTTSIPIILNLIEENDNTKLKIIDWTKFYGKNLIWKEVWRLFELCSEKEIKIKGLSAHFLEILLFNPDTGGLEFTQIFDGETREFVYAVNYQRNSFVGNVIHSLDGINPFVFLLEEMPYLEELLIRRTSQCQFRLWKRHGQPQWPNLRKIDIIVDNDGDQTINMISFLCERIERPKLEELSVQYERDDKRLLKLPLPDASLMVGCLGNLRKLTFEDCNGDSAFFITLWEGLPLLEHVELLGCQKLGNKGFLGDLRGRGSKPVFVKLENLKHLSIGGIHNMKRLTDYVFKEVFSRMKLVSLKLSGERSAKKRDVTVEGIKSLLTGNFAGSIKKLDFDELYLHGLSEEGRVELKSRFRSSKML